LIALIDEAEKLWPHSSSVIAFTLRVETPCSYISASARHQRPLRTLAALEQLGRKPPGAVLRHPQLGFANPRDRSWWASSPNDPVTAKSPAYHDHPT